MRNAEKNNRPEVLQYKQYNKTEAGWMYQWGSCYPRHITQELIEISIQTSDPVDKAHPTSYR